jgi:hypothetical protein
MTGARSLRLKHRLAGASAAALLGLSFACAYAIGPAEADKVGVAAAVNPDAFSSLAGAPQSQLSIGKSIFYNERINTTGSGLVQVLLVDGSTFTVGPGSDLVIDKFVYDPKKGTGQLAASFSKGVMRFVGGKLSKNDGGVTVDTPAGALAIRGGISYMDFKSPKNFSILFVFGEYLKLGGSTLYQPGYGWFSNNGQFTSRPFDGNDLKTILASLTNGNPNPTPSDPPKPKTLTTILNTQSLNQLISDANATQIQDQAQKAENQPIDNPQPPPCTGDCNPPPPPPCEDCDGAPLGHLQGYAGGLYVQTVNEEENDSPVGVLANWNSKHVDFDFTDQESSTFTENSQSFSALFKLRVGMPGDNQGGVDIRFGGPEYSFIGESGFAAISPPDGIKFFRDGLTPATPGEAEPFALLASSGLFDYDYNYDYDYTHVSNVPNQPTLPTFCSDCNFLQWGFFYTQGSFEDQTGHPPTTVQRNVSILGWWAAGDIPPVGQLPFTGTATYSGDAIATVATDLFSTGYSIANQGFTEGPTNGWTTYVATGELDMNWNFATKSGDLTISKFDTQHFGTDGLTFTGNMCAPGVTACGTNTPGGNHFGGALNGQLPENLVSLTDRALEGFALGSFARGPENIGAGSIPQGVIGNWGVGNDHYMASGIFAGAR